MIKTEVKKENDLYPEKKVTITFYTTKTDAVKLFKRTSLVTKLSEIFEKAGVKYFSMSSHIEDLGKLETPVFVRKKKHPWIRKDIDELAPIDNW